MRYNLEMLSVFRLALSVIFLFCAVAVSSAQETKIAVAEKAFAEAERLEKVWWKAGNVEKIVGEYEKSLTIWGEIGDKKREAETLLLIANAQTFIENRGGKSEKAKQLSLQAIEIFKTIGDTEGEALAMNNIAWQEGFYSLEKSKSLFEQALALAQKGKSRRAEAQILYSFGLVLNQTDFEKALEMLEKALPIAEELKDLQSQANVNFAFGLVYWSVGDYEKSLAHYEQANKLYKQFGDFSWATTSIENAALVYNLLEQPEKVIESYAEALPFRRENKQITSVADNLTNIAAALIKLNQPNKALENLDEAMKIYEQSENKYGIAWAWRIYGEAHFALGQNEKASSFFEKSRAQQAELGEQNGVAKAIYGLAQAELALGRLTEARKQIEAALDLIENQRNDLKSADLRLAFFSARRDFYELYLEILQRLHAENPQGNFDLSALEMSERARARNLFEILAGKTNAARLSAKEIQNLLDADTVLLEYTLGKNYSFLFVVTRDKIQIFRLPKADEIAPLVQEIRLALAEPGRRNYARFVTASRRLYEILLKPAESDLKAKKNLLVAPDAALNYLPFDVLLTNEPPRIGRADFQKLPFALHNWIISYTPSASVLAEISNRKSNIKHQTSPEFIAFADPIYGETNSIASNRVRRFVDEIFNSKALPRLTDSNREVSEIAKNFGASARVFLRQTATKQNVKQTAELETARIIHFATHAVVVERLPPFSGLLLSADSSEDGLLRAEEIYDLKLNADLVVLSACRTALGKNLRGEGIIGLTRAFLRAGGRSVAATLWQIPDASTADLMIDFYANLKTAPNKAAALRQAKLKMIKNERLAHPVFWASFVLIGEP